MHLFPANYQQHGDRNASKIWERQSTAGTSNYRLASKYMQTTDKVAAVAAVVTMWTIFHSLLQCRQTHGSLVMSQ